MTDRETGGRAPSRHEERPDDRSLPEESPMRVPAVFLMSLVLAAPAAAEDPEEPSTEEKLEALEQKVKILPQW